MTSTTEPEGTGEILKTDKLGRVQVPAARREAILDEFERSGMTGAAFAERYGINYQTFASWRQKRKKARVAASEEPARFLLVETTEGDPSPSSEALEVELSDGTRLHIRTCEEAALAAELLRALR